MEDRNILLIFVLTITKNNIMKLINTIKKQDLTTKIGLTVVALIVIPPVVMIVVELFNNPSITFGY